MYVACVCCVCVCVIFTLSSLMSLRARPWMWFGLLKMWYFHLSRRHQISEAEVGKYGRVIQSHVGVFGQSTAEEWAVGDPDGTLSASAAVWFCSWRSLCLNIVSDVSSSCYTADASAVPIHLQSNTHCLERCLLKDGNEWTKLQVCVTGCSRACSAGVNVLSGSCCWRLMTEQWLRWRRTTDSSWPQR